MMSVISHERRKFGCRTVCCLAANERLDITKNPGILQKYPIMAVPGIVIDGKLEFAGVPKEAELRTKVVR